MAVAGIFATFLTPVYTFWPVMRIFFGPPQPALENAKGAPLSMLLPLFALAIISFLFGIYPELATRFLIPAFSGIP